VAVVKNDVSEERTASIIRVTRIGELGICARYNSQNSPARLACARNAMQRVPLVEGAVQCWERQKHRKMIARSDSEG
jgi:demethoxyubiquinone hydroxylase (CLK1/Coq7/Cat5 family)